MSILKECCKISQVSGLYVTYAYSVHVRNSAISIFCNDISKVNGAWLFLRKKYPASNLRVHRLQVIDNVDNQMRRKNIAMIASIMKGVKCEESSIYVGIPHD